MSAEDNIFTREGTLLEAASNQPFWLSDLQTAWLIESGTVDLFAVPLASHEPAGSRVHFLRAEAGQVLLGLSPGASGDGLGFLAVGAKGTRLYKLPLARFQATAADPAQRPLASQWIDGWVQALYLGLGAGLLPKQLESVRGGEEVELPAGIEIGPANGVVWIKHRAGRSLLAGRPHLVLSPGDELVPLHSAVWVQTTEPTHLACLDTEAMIGRRLLWPNLLHFYAWVERWVQANLSQARAEEEARLGAKAEAERQILRNAVAQLSSVLALGPKAAAPLSAEDDPLFVACSLVGQAVGLALKPHPGARKSRRDPLGSLAKASRIRLRRVILRGDWWQQDNGPILAFRQDHHQPLALLPAAAGQYHAVEPVRRTRQPVTAALAQELNPVAYTFCRPFSDRALKVWDVFKFGLQNTEADWVIMSFMGLLGGLLGMLTPIVTGLIFDSVIPNADERELMFLVAALFVGALAAVIFEITRGIALLRLETRAGTSLQAAVWDRLLSLPLPFFREYTAGDLANRAGGIDAIRQIVSGAVLTAILASLFSFFNFGLLFYYSVRLAVVATGLMLLNIGVSIFVSFYSLRFQRPLCELQGKISGQVLQFITGITKLRVAGAEGHAYAVWAKSFGEQRRIGLRAGRFFTAMGVFNDVFPLLTTLSLFSAMAFWSHPGMTTGKFLAFNSAFMTFLYAGLAVSSACLSLLRTVPLYERARPILTTLPEVRENKADPGDLRGQLEFSHVSFRYKPDGPLVLKDVSFQINPGQFIAIVGPSGSGKSTLMRLLLGFDSPSSGTIYFDGADLAGLDVQAVRRQCGTVLQNGKLMPGDIFQNIVGTSLLSLEDAWDAARKSGLDEDINQMPMGMHTVLSEGAGTLSGGQRQRLMIARAIVHKPRILLFDEATSALDNRTQAIVSRSLEQLQATRVVIAHRLSTIQNANRILVLQNGVLVQSGAYQELMNQPGPFAELAARQLA